MRRLLGLAGAAVLLFFAASMFVELRWRGRSVRLAAAPEAPVALVFGAGLLGADQPSPVLAERLDMAIELYRAKRVKKLLVSGDNSERYHDETRAMKRYAVVKGVPAADVVGDFAGFSTYDSCYRAREIFGVRRAVLVTQDFHLPRALYIANGLGIDAWGVAADEGKPESGEYELRELWARPLALAMVLVGAEPRLLGPKEPID
ncbi:MAG: SanA/YdcF family protein [Myxococcaceae bacterium]